MTRHINSGCLCFSFSLGKWNTILYNQSSWPQVVLENYHNQFFCRAETNSIFYRASQTKSALQSNHSKRTICNFEQSAKQQVRYMVAPADTRGLLPLLLPCDSFSTKLFLANQPRQLRHSSVCSASHVVTAWRHVLQYGQSHSSLETSRKENGWVTVILSCAAGHGGEEETPSSQLDLDSAQIQSAGHQNSDHNLLRVPENCQA